MDNVKTYQPGEVVIKENTKSASAYIILSGTAKVTKRIGKREIKMAKLGPKQVFGEMGLIDNRPRSATITAESELKVREIDNEEFNNLLLTKPDVIIPILKSFFERLRQASKMLAERTAYAYIETGKEKAFEVIMEGQTLEAKEVLDNATLRITKFPFLIGRVSAVSPDTDVFYNNDLAIDEEKPYIISRNHVAIKNESGTLWVEDRGSAFGTIVNGKEIGGKSDETRALLDKEKNQLIIGPAQSPYIFLLRLIPV
jgi:CRP-like cAMP-binding protein